MSKLFLSAFLLLVSCSFNLFAQEQIKVIRAVAPKYSLSQVTLPCGKVIVQIEVNSEGNVANTKAISGHPELRAVSQKAAGKWLFSPFDTEKIRKIDLIFKFECEYKSDGEDISTIYDSPYQINILYPKELLKVSNGRTDGNH